nr:hypothetical protein Iba_chr15aCG7300 [Ipomoea batatas]GMD99753.1 hypothetical protein Iba_chr15eCG6850 [Ipomoea batatas]
MAKAMRFLPSTSLRIYIFTIFRGEDGGRNAEMQHRLSLLLGISSHLALSVSTGIMILLGSIPGIVGTGY